MTVRSATGKVKYTLLYVRNPRYKKYFRINSNTGAVTVKKKCKKGTYTLGVCITDPGDSNHSITTRIVECKIRVK